MRRNVSVVKTTYIKLGLRLVPHGKRKFDMGRYLSLSTARIPDE